jgi:hypothetical protein
VRLRDAVTKLSGNIVISGRGASYGFFERLLTAGPGLKLDGDGDLNGTLHIEAGRLVAGSELNLNSPLLPVELDTPAPLDPEGRIAEQGAGTMRTAVTGADDPSQTRLQVELREMEARRGTGGPVVFAGKVFRLTATGPELDPGEPLVEPAMVVELEDTSAPDAAILHDFLPSTPLFRPSVGVPRLDGRLEYAKGVVTGSLRLAGERIVGRLLGLDLVGELGVDLLIGRADYTTKQLDQSGTEIRMQAARDEAQDDSPLSTEIKILEARLTPSADRSARQSDATMPPLDGSLRLEGKIASLELLNAFLPGDSQLEIGGEGRITAGLELQRGRLAAGSQMEVASGRLVSRFLDLEATGLGLVQAEIQSAEPDQELSVQVGLRDMAVLRRNDDKPVLRGDALDLTASGPLPGPGETPAEPRLTM